MTIVALVKTVVYPAKYCNIKIGASEDIQFVVGKWITCRFS